MTWVIQVTSGGWVNVVDLATWVLGHTATKDPQVTSDLARKHPRVLPYVFAGIAVNTIWGVVLVPGSHP